jgi:hypothetical protein
MAKARNLAQLAQGQVGLVLQGAQDAPVWLVKVHATPFATGWRGRAGYSNMLPQGMQVVIRCSNQAGMRAGIGDPVSADLS